MSGEWYNESGVEIDATAGITIIGGKLTLKDSAGGHSAQLYIDTSGHLRLDSWGYIDAVTIQCSSNILAQHCYVNGIHPRSGSYTELYCKLKSHSSIYGFIFLTVAPAEEGSMKIKGGGDNDLYIYTNGAWRTNG